VLIRLLAMNMIVIITCCGEWISNDDDVIVSDSIYKVNSIYSIYIDILSKCYKPDTLRRAEINSHE